MISELKRIIDQISRDKGINRDLLIEAIEEAVMSAAKKKYGHRREIEARYNDEYGEIELFQFRTVVDEVTDEQTEISLIDAKELDSEVEMGDELGSKMDSAADLGRIAAQSAKQVIIQKMKEAESDVVFDLFKERKGDIVNGIVQRFERGNMIVNLGRTDAILPSREQMPRKSYRQGDRIRAYLLDVRQSSKEPQLILSRTCNEFLTKLFTMEVPEIAEGIVKVMGVAREPGSRAKIAVSSTESDVDPVGACVGMKGSRVQNVVQELQGEKIDIVPWSPDPARFVSNALAPAQVSMVVVDEENNTLLVVVPDDQLSLAIGRQGQNVRMASALLGWRIDVKSETKYSRSIEDGFQSLLDVEGITEKQAEKLYDSGVASAAELAAADPAEVVATLGLEEPEAQALVTAAAQVAPREEDEQAVAGGAEAPPAAPDPEAVAETVPPEEVKPASEENADKDPAGEEPAGESVPSEDDSDKRS
ncbi:transcription termination factor NusA [Desulfurivibrio dismutans]|uniref:transcription termination factor NusA n=1 Tax=Desulfurivibrio dismutans TaxID=1398908 RepID=UPI0023DAAF98|nr:transcription termination factor NusA [Desulfurivibrio alkaliphilus]MDF1615638.1 transcription termination factor NusA [Desulfurivibrio alkaliphilus]